MGGGAGGEATWGEVDTAVALAGACMHAQGRIRIHICTYTIMHMYVYKVACMRGRGS